MTFAKQAPMTVTQRIGFQWAISTHAEDAAKQLGVSLAEVESVYKSLDDSIAAAHLADEADRHMAHEFGVYSDMPF